MLELKMAVLKTAEIEELRPGHCKLLSDLIFGATRKRISVTTLKRIYGFAGQRVKPFRYTISALEEYSQMVNK
jgi:hypothetical protein